MSSNASFLVDVMYDVSIGIILKKVIIQEKQI